MSEDPADLDTRAHRMLEDMYAKVHSHMRAQPKTIRSWALIVAALLGRDREWREPMPELKGTRPVVLYFQDEAEVSEFVRAVQEVKPGLRSRRL